MVEFDSTASDIYGFNNYGSNRSRLHECAARRAGANGLGTSCAGDSRRWVLAERVLLMNKVGSLVGIPHGAWSGGQSRLFDGGDVRLVWLLRRLAHQKSAQAVASGEVPRSSFLCQGCVDRNLSFVEGDTHTRRAGVPIGAEALGVDVLFCLSA